MSSTHALPTRNTFSDSLIWLRLSLQLEGSVAPLIFPRVLLLAGWGCLVSGLNIGPALSFLRPLGDLSGNVVVNLVLGLLLVFRTNTAYDRFWEGRKAWGTLVVTLRNLAREVQISVAAPTPEDALNKQAALKLLVAFAVATKLHLRQAQSNDELLPLLMPEQVSQLTPDCHRPLKINLWLRTYLQQQHQQEHLDLYQMIEMNTLISSLTEGLTACERIATTPMPIAYGIYLKRLILFFCISLPFRLVADLGWWTGPMMAVISFILLGIEEIGNEIENPFGYDANDLPIDQVCQNLANNIQQIGQMNLDQTNLT